MFVMDFMENHWKRLMWITIAFLVFSVALLAYTTATTGSFMKRDVDLSGGQEITVQVGSIDLQKVKDALPYAEVHLTTGLSKTLIVDIPFDKNETQALNDLRQAVSFEGTPSVRSVGPALGNIFFQQAQLALVAAFALMAITVFIIFRSPAPSSIVILCAATDIVGTMAVLDLLGIALSLPVLAALLTLIGYSVDTDILLTNELLKSGRQDHNKSIRMAMKTGLTFTGTTLIALLAMFFVSGSLVIEQIALVLLIGLVIDIPATWLTNAGVMRLWLERKSAQ